MSVDKVMPQIKHVVVLMQENRSLDALCGWLYEDDSPEHLIIGDSEINRPEYDGLQAEKHTNSLKTLRKVKEYPVTKASVENLRIPSYNPHEDYEHVNNQLYGNAENSYYETPSSPKPAEMKGFLQDYSALYERHPEEILACYTLQSLPVLNGLAKSFAISDRWFSSVPTQTNPNRAFFACGTSLGREINLIQPPHIDTAVERFPAKTIWNVLSEHNVDWTIYYHDIWKDKKCYTEYTFPLINRAKNRSKRKRFASIGDFQTDAHEGKLPPFTFLEPKWGYGAGRLFNQGNDYHPPTSLAQGDKFVQWVYEALTHNETAWNQTLFVITFDEHGGTYDHVPPPWTAVRPDNRIGRDYRFKFDRFGVRVPTVLISRYIQEKTVFRAAGTNEYDHTSLTATILKWQDIDPKTAGLRNRVANAPTFEHVLTKEPRLDVPALKALEISSPAEPVSALAKRLENLPVPAARSIVEASKNEREIDQKVSMFEQIASMQE